MRILVTGGHATPAIACIKELQSRGFSKIAYVGQKKSILFDKKNSSEYRQITEQIKIPFYNLIAGKFSLFPNISSLIWLLRLPIGFIHAFFLILYFRPKLILTFGSHIGVPICFWGWAFRIPIIAHEQTTTIGRSNAFIQNLANKICLSWPGSIQQLKDEIASPDSQARNDKYILTGNPVRSEIKNLIYTTNTFDFVDKNKKTLLITGGNQGAHIINEWIFANLETLSLIYNIIHQTGSNSLFNDFEKALNLASNINKSGNIYIPKDYIFTEEMSEALSKANFIISRAGANSLIEFVILRKKALLIPIPTTSGNEQFLNAKFLADLGLAKVLDQTELAEIDLLENLESLNLLQVDEQKAKEFAELHLGAEKKIVDLVEELLISN